MKLFDDKIIYVENLPTLARIGHTTKSIQVHPRFGELSEEMKDFIILQLGFLLESKDDYFVADKKALEKATKLYPKKTKHFWIKNIENMLLSEAPDLDLTSKRIVNLCQ